MGEDVNQALQRGPMHIPAPRTLSARVTGHGGIEHVRGGDARWRSAAARPSAQDCQPGQMAFTVASYTPTTQGRRYQAPRPELITLQFLR